MFELPHGDAIDQEFDGSAMNEIMDFLFSQYFIYLNPAVGFHPSSINLTLQ